MGDSKRRKQLDPNYGKSSTMIENADVANWSEKKCIAFLLEQSRKNKDNTVDRYVFLSPTITELGDHRLPLFVAIGHRLNRLGGLDLMKKACMAVYEAEAKRNGDRLDCKELSMCWHEIGGWLD